MIDARLGTPIHIEGKLVRLQKRVINKPNRYPSTYKYKYWELVPFKRDGIIIGLRTLRNGSSIYEPYEGWYFDAEEYIPAIIVAFSMKENPVYIPLDKYVEWNTQPQPEGEGDRCKWIRVFDGHFNISCPSGERANGDFKRDNDHYANWEFKFCPYCGREIELLPTDSGGE